MFLCNSAVHKLYFRSPVEDEVYTYARLMHVLYIVRCDRKRWIMSPISQHRITRDGTNISMKLPKCTHHCTSVCMCDARAHRQAVGIQRVQQHVLGG